MSKSPDAWRERESTTKKRQTIELPHQHGCHNFWYKRCYSEGPNPIDGSLRDSSKNQSKIFYTHPLHPFGDLMLLLDCNSNVRTKVICTWAIEEGIYFCYWRIDFWYSNFGMPKLMLRQSEKATYNSTVELPCCMIVFNICISSTFQRYSKPFLCQEVFSF